MTSTIFGKAWGALAVTLVVVWSVFWGMDIKSQDWRMAIIDGILLVFWIFLLVWLHYASLRQQRLEIKAEQSQKELDKSLKQLMDSTLRGLQETHDHDLRLEKALHQAHHEICGDRIARQSEYKKVEARFHEITGDHYLKLEKSSDPHANGRPDVTMSDRPFSKEPTKKKAPVKKSVTKKTVTTKKGK